MGELYRAQRQVLRGSLAPPKALALAIIGALAACSPSPPADESTLVVAAVDRPVRLDPAALENPADQAVSRALFTGLTVTTATLEVRPAVAEMWSFSDDFRTITFTLRDDVLWSDGSQVTAHDFVFAWRRLFEGSANVDLLSTVRQADAIRRGEQPVEALGVTAEGPYTVVVELTAPTLHFPQIAASPALAPVPSEVVSNHGSRWTRPEHIVTNGPFRLAERTPGYDLTLQSAERGWGPAPLVERVLWREAASSSEAVHWFRQGQVDVALGLDTTAVWRGSEFWNWSAVPTTYFLAFDRRRAPFLEPDARRAVALAVDREALAAVAGGLATPATTWVPPNVPGHHADAGLETDLAYAAALWGSLDSPPTELTLLYVRRLEDHLLAREVARQLEASLPVSVDLESCHARDLQSRLAAAPPSIYLDRLAEPVAHAETLLAAFARPGPLAVPELPFTHYFRQIPEETAMVERRRLYRSAERGVLRELVAAVPLVGMGRGTLVSGRVAPPDAHPVHLIDLERVSWAR